MITLRKYISIALLCLFNCTAIADGLPQNLIIKEAWIAEAPPVSKVMVAYMQIENPTIEKLTIIKAESDLYSSIEFHETVYEDGLAKMIRYTELPIDAGSTVSLKRGGKHLMLFNPTKRLHAGDTVKIKITTSNHNVITTTANVIKAQY